jgi:hypothetical protein
MLRRAKLCGEFATVRVTTVVTAVSIAAAAMTMAIVPATPASAALAKSSVCKAYSAEEKRQAKASAALEKEIASGSWATIKKDLLAAVNSDVGAEKEFAGFVRSASPNVKSAARVILGLDASFKKIIERSTSLITYESGINEAEQTPKVKAAESLLDQYTTSLCGSTTAAG